MRHFDRASGLELLKLDRLRDGDGASRPIVFMKTARILAIRIDEPFEVETEHGTLGAEAGDWLVTNHPDDDANSDIWPISNTRLEASYHSVKVPTRPAGESPEQARARIERGST